VSPEPVPGPAGRGSRAGVHQPGGDDQRASCRG
jgi:hypothetical protein